MVIGALFVKLMNLILYEPLVRQHTALPGSWINYEEHKASIPGTEKELISLSTSRKDIRHYVAAIVRNPELTTKDLFELSATPWPQIV